MTNLKQGGGGNFVINNTYIPLDKATFVIKDGVVRVECYFPIVGVQEPLDQITLDGVTPSSEQEVIDWVQNNCFKKKVVDGGYKGVATTETEPIMEGGATYRALMAGTYTNFKDSEGNALVVTSDDLAAGFVYLLGTDGVFEINVDATKEYVDQAIAGVNLDHVAINSGSTALNPYQLLVKTDAGTFEHRNWNQSVIAEAFAVRTSSGDLNLPLAPNNDASATSKKYVDTQDAAVTFDKVNTNSSSPINNVTIVAKNNNGTWFGLGYSSSNIATTAMIRDANGCTNVSNPTANTHTVNLQTLLAQTKSKTELLALTKISDPATATTEQVATLLNSLIDALKA